MLHFKDRIGYRPEVEMCPVAALSTLTEQKIGEQYDTMVVDIIPTLND